MVSQVNGNEYDVNYHFYDKFLEYYVKKNTEYESQKKIIKKP